MTDIEFRKRRTFKPSNLLPNGWNTFEASKKSDQSNSMRVFMAYVVLFVLGVTTLSIFQYLRPTKIQSDVGTTKNDWHLSITQARPEQVINHHYDNLAVSILLSDTDFETSTTHSSITTFLLQVNHLQVCNDHVAHTYIGGQKGLSIPFFPLVPELPRVDRYIHSYLTMLEFAPSQDWFIQLDQDTYPFLENIQLLLKRYKPTNALFFHNFDVFPRDAKHIPDVEDKNHFPISIMSRKAIELISSKGYPKCLLGYKHVPSLETILVHCLEDMGVSVVQLEEFHPTEPTHDFKWPSDPCKRPLSISNLDEKQRMYLFRARPETGTKDGITYKWDTVMTYADIFHYTFSSNRPTPNIDRHSSSSQFQKAISGKDCLELCEEMTSCVSWTFVGSEQGCWLAETAGVYVPRQGVISGLVSSRYNC